MDATSAQMKPVARYEDETVELKFIVGTGEEC